MQNITRRRALTIMGGAALALAIPGATHQQPRLTDAEIEQLSKQAAGATLGALRDGLRVYSAARDEQRVAQHLRDAWERTVNTTYATYPLDAERIIEQAQDRFCDYLILINERVGIESAEA